MLFSILDIGHLSAVSWNMTNQKFFFFLYGRDKSFQKPKKEKKEGNIGTQ